MKTWFACRTLVLLLGLSVIVTSSWAQDNRVFTQQELMQDARQLASILGESHPDPYINGGGKVAFHRRLQVVLENIPADGMTGEEFFRLLLPFVASLRDGHTALLSPLPGTPSPPGIPLSFKIIDESLAVASAVRKDNMDIRGALLMAVDGIPVKELVKRQDNLRGIENVYGTLALLTRSLSTEKGLRNLIPERTDPTMVLLTLGLANGETRDFLFEREEGLQISPIEARSSILLPDMSQTDVAWRFLDNDGRTALLKIDDMSGYREAVEAWIAAGMSEGLDMARAAYQRHHEKAAPERVDDILAGLPSATDAFKELVVAMKRAETRHLIVDLRENTGGNDLMVPILLYFLFDRESLNSYDDGFQISRYSELYFQMYANASLSEINQNRAIPLQIGDYDFSDEPTRSEGSNQPAVAASPDERLRESPTFYRVFRQNRYENYYRPPHLVVLSAAWTYSSGFTMLAALEKLGATVIGTPSAHAGNNFGDSLLFQLSNSQLRGAVSFKQNVTFPDDPSKGRSLRPDIMLTHDKWASLNFDPNAEVLLALEYLEGDLEAERTTGTH